MRTSTSRMAHELEQLRLSSNYRAFPQPDSGTLIDLTSNDYLGIALRDDLRDEFMAINHGGKSLAMTSSASRLLASCQQEYADFESALAEAYSRPALLFNSGYHANTGIIQAIADKRTLIVADKLVHASIIDGIRLSGARFTRFPHNDFDRLERIVAQVPADEADRILVVVESVYSMDGDRADIDRLIDLRRTDERIMLYVDEAHGVGVEGPAGLGLVAASKSPAEVDIVIGTLGKALASSGAFAIVDDLLRQYLVNKARSLIFSTALPPACVAWSRFIFGKMMEMDAERATLRSHAHRLADAIAKATGHSGIVSHIQPLIIGDAAATLQRSARLLSHGVKVLPIRTPTVPPGSERLRFSLSAALTDTDIAKVAGILATK